MLRKENIILSAICLQETWLTDDSYINLFSLDGYTTITFPATCSSHTGLVIYLHDSLNFDIRQVEFNNKIWEGIFVDIQHESFNKDLTLCNIYRPPRSRNADIDLFLEDFAPVIASLSSNSNNVALCGDLNIDLLQIDHRLKFNEYFDMYVTNGFKSNITLPTRFSERNATLIDHIFSKLNNTAKSKSGIIYSKISDHLPCVFLVSFKKRFEPRPKKVKVQKKNEECFNAFYTEIATHDFWSGMSLDINEDPTNNYNTFNCTLTDLVAKHFPIKTVKFNKYKHKCSPWITNGILKSLKKRDNLYRKLKSCNPTSPAYNTHFVNLDTFNAILKKIIRQAKQAYHFSQFNIYRKDSRKTWKVINSMLNSNKHKKGFPNFFMIDNVKTANPEIIASRFNHFFSNVGSSLSSKLRTHHLPHFTTFLTRPIPCTFAFKNVTEEDLIRLFSLSKPKSTLDPDGL
jgi:hypothetical protein